MKIYHGKDLRRGRYSEPGQPYLVTTVTCARRPLFLEWPVSRLLVWELRSVTDQKMVDTLAWVLIPDHLHWLVVLRDVALDKIVLRVKSKSALAINRHRGSQGPVWQKGYHDHALRREEDIKNVARYIVANPLRANLVKHLGDYPFWDAIWL